MLKFFAASFAVAGVLAAAGPIVIHLLNRRRFRVIEWAAMDFLRQAMQRNRRILQLRDLLILLLRVLCVLLFGMALARPYFSQLSSLTLLGALGTAIGFAAALATAIWAIFATNTKIRMIRIAACVLALGFAGLGVFGMVRETGDATANTFSGRQPVHAVLVIDNSLSMGYEALNGNLVDQAKAKATEFVDALPPESRVSVIPLCGLENGYSNDAYRNKQDAREAIERIKVVDRTGTAAQAIELAAQACDKVPELETKRVVFLSDQQTSAWPVGPLKTSLGQLPELQVVRIGRDSAEKPQNVWVANFRVPDGIADIETPTAFVADVGYQGSHALDNVQLTLTVDGLEVAARTFEMSPGQIREIELRHIVDVPADPGRPNFISASVSVTTDSVDGDRLKNDNQRYLTVPVVAGLPVVFVDQFGANEDLDKNDIGETYRLRQLLAPRSTRDESSRQLIQVRHTSIARLDREMLEDARLVIISGIASPEETVPLLRQYVEQGGQLVITAGAEFDCDAWTEKAWLDGGGILPCPIKSEMFGETPEVSIDQLKPFYLDFNSMQHDYFLIAGVSRDELESLYRLPLFFKAVEAELGAAVDETLIQAETQRIEQVRKFLAESDTRRQQWEEMEKHGTFGATQEAEREADIQQRNEMAPHWLRWGQKQLAVETELAADQIASMSRARVLAAFAGNNLSFLVERRIGSGRVLLVSTGVYSSWNTLTSTNTILIFDRIFRGMLENTMPKRNYAAGETMTLETQSSERLRYTLARPSGLEETMTVEALGPDSYGVTVRNSFHRGHYRLTAYTDDSATAGNQAKITEVPLSVNGPELESELTSLNADELKQRMGTANYRWIEGDEPISLEGAQIRGRDVWKWLVRLVLFALVMEMLILAWPRIKEQLAQRAQAK